MDKNNINKTNKVNATLRKIDKRGRIGWCVLFLAGLAVPVGFLVALFFALYSADASHSFFLILAILGIILYVLFAFFFVKTMMTHSDPNHKPSLDGVPTVDMGANPGLSAGIIGLALYRGLFGKRNKSGSKDTWEDLHWQEKYRHRD